MTYQPSFTITPNLLRLIEQITALRERIFSATVHVAWIPKLQRDTRVRNTHSSTAIEGNPLTLEQVRALEEGRAMTAITERSRREVLNSLAGLRFIENRARKKRIAHEDVLKLHAILGAQVMDQGKAGRYREILVRVGRYLPPAPEMVSGLMSELLEWWNKEASKWSPIISSAVIHHHFEDIHPFADGNGRTGRTLALWELYRRGFDTHHIFSIDEFYWEDRPRYYRSLAAVRKAGGDLTGWLEYTAEGLSSTLEKVWSRIQRLSAETGHKKIVLRPKQEKLLLLLRDHKSLTPRQIWEGIAVSKQGAMDILNPLIEAGLVRRVGTKKSGRYILA
jgi:Fic family protein